MFDLRKQLVYRGFLENRHSQNLRDLVGSLAQSLAVLQQMNQHVHDHRDPQLGLDRVGGRAEKRLDVQVLLHPFEQQFDFPTLAIQERDRQRIERQMIGQERQPLAGLRIDIADPPQGVGIRACAILMPRKRIR